MSHKKIYERGKGIRVLEGLGEEFLIGKSNSQNEWEVEGEEGGGGFKKAFRAEILSMECFMAKKRLEGKGIVLNRLWEKGRLAWLKGEGIYL